MTYGILLICSIKVLPPIPTDLYSLYRGLKFWERWHVRSRWRLCPFLQIAGHIPDRARIVDIGCGRGLLANYLALRGPARQVTGIDKQTRRITAAQASVGTRKNIHFRHQDALDLRQEEFDVIVISDMLHHLTHGEQDKLLEHCYRILPPGGILLLEDVMLQPRWKWLTHFIIDRVLNLGEKQYFRALENWISFIKSLGFNVESYDAHRHIPLPDFLLRCEK